MEEELKVGDYDDSHLLVFWVRHGERRDHVEAVEDEILQYDSPLTENGK
jgi:hypothetical protein